ncbi:MAG: hypothetical protein IJ300_04720 [Clostridia bacterium]|nr:hypothetical protein [Clostridia bacterium]
MKKETRLKLISCLIATIVLISTILSGCASSGKDNTQTNYCEYITVGEDITEQIKDSTDDVLLLKSAKYSLMIDVNGVLKVVDENNRVFWSSGSTNSDNLSGDEALSSSVIKYHLNNAVIEMDTYSDSYEKEQFRVYRNGNTIVYEQIMGDFVDDLLLPEALSEERYEDIIAQMSDKDAKYISRQYTLYTSDNVTNDILEKVPNIKDKAYYVLMDNDSYAQRTRIHKAFLSINYTKNDLQSDRADAGIQLDDQGDVFKIVMNFTFENDELVVDIPCDQMYYPEELPIVSAQLFKYGTFGEPDSKGSYIVPSGSGAEFNFTRNKSADYALRFDGVDYSNSVTDEALDYSSHPVFGALYQDAGYVAIVEEGSEVLQLNVESVSEGYVLYPELLLTPWQQISAGRNVILHAEDSYAGNVKIRYSFLNNEEANYSEMAAIYQNYLEKTGAFENKSLSTELPFEFETINSIYVKDNVAGIPYTTELVTTSFDETKNMVEWFSEQGIDNIWLKLNGANKRGLFAQAPGDFEISNKAGGKDGYKNLKDYCDEIKAQMFLNVNLPFYYDDKTGDSYKSNKDTARQLDQKKVQVYLNEKSTMAKRTDLPTLEVVSSDKFLKYAENYTKISQTLGSGISVGELTRTLNSDFTQGSYISRTVAKNTVKESLCQLQGQYNILAENPAAYALNLIYGIEKLPLSSSGYEIFERDIPLIPLALHGKISYTSTYWNSQTDMQKARLKAIEYGSGISYRFAYNIDKEAMNGHNSFLYNVDYTLWKETAAENYRYVSEALKGLNNVPIKSHKYISENVVKATYENGTVIYINYSDEAVVVDGLTINSESYLRV